MLSPVAVLNGTAWEGLEHAYGPASDAPAHLVMLLSEDAAQCGAALAYLDAAILHQGSMYPATVPAAVFVAGILDDPRTLISCTSALPWDDREQPLRAALLEWLGQVARSARPRWTCTAILCLGPPAVPATRSTKRSAPL